MCPTTHGISRTPRKQKLMRIAIAHTDFRLYWLPRLKELHRMLAEAGSELVVIEIAGRGFPYDFARQESVGDTNPNWIRLFDGDIGSLSPKVISRALFAKLDELKPDVVVAGAIAFTSGATAVRWCRQRHKPVVIMDDARHEDVPRSKLTNYLKRRVYRNVDAVLIPAPSHAGSFVRWGIPQNRIFYGVDVVDNESFSQRAQQARSHPARERSRLDLPENFFLAVGRQVPKKNFATLIQAYSAYCLRHSHPWDLVLVGDGPERQRLEQLAADAGLKGIHFLPFLSQLDVSVCYALARALLLPSFYGETWGNVVNEAMACATPVLVSSQCGCSQTLVQESVNGWTFDPDSPSELTRLLDRVTALTAQQLETMGRKSAEIISHWPLHRFAHSVWQAARTCNDSSRGFHCLGDMLFMHLWKGRFRPT